MPVLQEHQHTPGKDLWPTCRHMREERWQNPAAQLTRCVGKYIFALNPEVVQEERLLNVDPINSYLEDLTRGSGVGDEWGTSPHTGPQGSREVMRFTVSYFPPNGLAPMHNCLSHIDDEGHSAEFMV